MIKKVFLGILITFLILSLVGCVAFIIRSNNNSQGCKHENLKIVYGTPATCTENGFTDGVECADCGVVVTAQKEVAAHSHNEIIIKGKAATYTETGLTDGVECVDCGVVITTQKVIPILDSSDLLSETMTISTYATENAWTNATQYNAVNIGEKFSVNVVGGANSGKFYNGGEWRLYQSENASLVFIAADGYAICNIRVIYSYTNGGVLTTADSSENYLSNENIFVGGEQSFTLCVGSSSGSIQGQVKITEIVIEYKTV